MNSSRHLARTTAACVALLLAGCGAGADDAPAADATPAAAGAAAGTATDTAAAGFEDVPTADELESQLATQVTDANADAEFEKLQAELAAEDDG